MKKNHLFALGIVVISMVLGSCNPSTADKTESKDSAKVETVPATPAKAAVDYSGIYTVTDKSVCDLTIEIQKKDNGFSYVSGTSKGNIEIINQEGEVYLNFMAINGKSPKGDVEAKYENETLMIQNEGNAMNPYSIFKKCDTKFLELKKK